MAAATSHPERTRKPLLKRGRREERSSRTRWDEEDLDCLAWAGIRWSGWAACLGAPSAAWGVAGSELAGGEKDEGRKRLRRKGE